MVPEVDHSGDLSPDFSSYIADVKRGVVALGAKATPVVMGPVSMTRFVVFKDTPKFIPDWTPDLQRSAFLDKLIPIYAKLLEELAEMGVEEIQIHEPSH